MVVVVAGVDGATDAHMLELVTHAMPSVVASSERTVERGIPALRHFFSVTDQPHKEYITQPAHVVARAAHSVFLTVTGLGTVVVVAGATAGHMLLDVIHWEPDVLRSSDRVVERGTPALRHFCCDVDQPHSMDSTQPLHDEAYPLHSEFLALISTSEPQAGS